MTVKKLPMKITFYLVIILILGLNNSYGQNQLVLKRQNNPEKVKVVDLSQAYIIATKDSIYGYRNIVNYTDSNISVLTWVDSGRDTTYTYSFVYQGKDTSYTRSNSIYVEDTLLLSISAIQYLKKDWLQNTKWAEPFGWIGMAAVLGVVMLPVAAITDGNEGVREWATFEALLIGISAPPIFLVTRKIKYDLIKKWTLEVEDLSIK